VFDNLDGTFTSVNVPRVHVRDQEVTSNILINRQDVSELVKFSNIDGTLKQKPVAILPNSSNKGYCRVLLDQASVDHFVEHFMEAHVSTYNRTYLWRILFDHIQMLKLQPAEFLDIVIKNLLREK
jgi:hypothetical protein